MGTPQGVTTIFVIVLVCCSIVVSARKHSFHLQGSQTPYEIIDTFGFGAGGRASFSVWSAQIPKGFSGGFLLYRDLDPDTMLALEDGTPVTCLPDRVPVDISSGDIQLRFPFLNGTDSFFLSETIYDTGLYTALYYSCSPEPVTFQAYIELLNPGNNHLQIGEVDFPALYFIFFLVFSGMSAFWIYFILRRRDYLSRLHWLFAVLVVVKALSLFFNWLRYIHIRDYGSSDGFAIPFYLFSIARAVVLFLVILLVGSGWSYLEPVLSKSVRKLVAVVLCIQLFINIALAIITEEYEFYMDFVVWRDLLRILDFVCCIIILVPIMNTIRRISEAQAREGPTLLGVEKLRKFRSFYLVTILFLYWTRIAVVIFVGAAGYQYLWMSIFLTESATVLYYLWVFWEFRPFAENPYLMLQDPETGQIIDLSEFSTELGVVEEDDNSSHPSDSSRYPQRSPAPLNFGSGIQASFGSAYTTNTSDRKSTQVDNRGRLTMLSSSSTPSNPEIDLTLPSRSLSSAPVEEDVPIAHAVEEEDDLFADDDEGKDDFAPLRGGRRQAGEESERLHPSSVRRSDDNTFDDDVEDIEIGFFGRRSNDQRDALNRNESRRPPAPL